MNFYGKQLNLTQLAELKLIGFVLFFFLLASFSLQASTLNVETSVLKNNTTHCVTNDVAFEITSAFISTWKVKEIRDHAVLEVIETNDFITAHEITEELRKFITEPIMVKHGYKDDAIVYTIIIGRFSNVDQAMEYHNMLR